MIYQSKELLLLLLAVLLSHGQCECPIDWLEHKDKCYYISEDTKTWKEANVYCLSKDSNLTSILDDDEKEWLMITFRQEKAWLGLTDEETEGVWKWTDGSFYNESMAKWGYKQPNNYDASGKHDANCVAMVTGYGGRWSDYNCNRSKEHYVCKHEAMVLVPTVTGELNKTEEMALELVTKMALTGKVVANPGFNVSEAKLQSWSPDDVSCGYLLAMKADMNFTFAAVYNVSVGKLIGVLGVGSRIAVGGRVKPNAKRFSVDLTFDGGKQFALHLEPRFNYFGDVNMFVRNSYLSGSWGKEERQLDSFPFAPGQFFEMIIQCDADAFHVSFDDDVQLDYKYRVDLGKITHVSVSDDVMLTDVKQM